jgi:hypothetical protein
MKCSVVKNEETTNVVSRNPSQGADHQSVFPRQIRTYEKLTESTRRLCIRAGSFQRSLGLAIAIDAGNLSSVYPVAALDAGQFQSSIKINLSFKARAYAGVSHCLVEWYSAQLCLLLPPTC